MKRVAVVGSGIAGLTAAWYLSDPENPVHVTLYEAEDYAGGHTHTVDVTLPDAAGHNVTHGVDTGFLVFNHRTYPGLVRHFHELGVETAESDMSFSVQVLDQNLEWCGSSLATVFAQPANALRPAFWGMLSDLLRFNRQATSLATEGTPQALQTSIGQFLLANNYSAAFRDWYLIPMISSIWSCQADQMLKFPMSTLVRFCHNHGLLQVTNRPQWYTVRGGARNYVQKMLSRIAEVKLSTPVFAVRRRVHGAGVEVVTAEGTTHFDAVVMACHADQALAMLGADAHPQERELLSTIGYQPNTAVLHTDTSVLPQRRRAWAAWNYEHSASQQDGSGVCLHYLLNRLQPLPFAQPVVVSLNPLRAPRPETVLGTYQYSHPVFDLSAVRSQSRLESVQGMYQTWFCGAWTGYGFHEDGFQSGRKVAEAVRCRLEATDFSGLAA